MEELKPVPAREMIAAVYPTFCCRCGAGFWAIVEWAHICDACDKAVQEAEEEADMEANRGY